MDFHYIDNDWLGSDVYPYEGFNEYAKYIENVVPKIKINFKAPKILTQFKPNADAKAPQ